MHKVMPSIFAQDLYFSKGKQVTSTSETSDFTVGATGMQPAKRRNNAITIGKSTPGAIPQAMRSVKG